MKLFGQHPATQRLLRQQSRARLTRVLRSFHTPRRALLSLIALVLSVIWISQGVAGVMFREAAEPDKLLRWLALGMTAFALWNLVKITFRQPVEPFEWSEAEKEWLCAAPLSRGHLIRYRIAGISAAALFKTTIFVGVMTPDLHFWLVGFLGMYLGLMVIELMRMAMEVLIFGINQRQRRILKVAVGAVMLVGILAAVTWYAGQWRAGQFENVVSLSFFRCTQNGLQLIPQSSPGSLICAPFGALATIILSNQLSWWLVARVVAAVVTLFLMIRGLQWLDAFMFRLRQRSHKRSWNTLMTRSTDESTDKLTALPSERSSKIRTAPRGGAMGALIWRQFTGLRHYLGTVLFSLAMPMFFALGPAFGPQKEWPLVQVLVLMLVFWSFFLIPAALKFDFRRDLNRINVLKALPMKPTQIVIAQLVVPVAATSVFQLTTLLVAMMFNPFSPSLLLVAMAILVPFNIFIYALENLIFLLYPYRITEESIRVFLRAILAFTAKGFLLGIVAGAGLLLMLGSVLLCRSLQVSDPQSTSLVIFAVASFLFGLAGSGALVAFLARTFDRLDPSQDLSTAEG